MSNYPDDIRNYDHDPRSPFYESQFGECPECEAEFEDEDRICIVCAEKENEE